MLNKLVKNSDQSEILKKGGSFLVFRGGGLLLSFLFTWYITNYYGADTWGLVALGFTIFLFAGIISRMGFDINLVTFYAREENQMDNRGLFLRLLGFSFGISVLVAGGLYLLKPWLVNSIFKKPDLAAVYDYAILAIPLWTVILLCGGLLRAQKRNNWFAFLNNPGRFFFALILLLILTTSSFDYLVPIKAHFYALIILAAIALTVVVLQLRSFTKGEKQSVRKFTFQSLPMMISSSIVVVLGGFDVLVIGAYESEENVAIYNICVKLALLTLLSLQSINSILAPKIVKDYHAGQMDKFSRNIQFSTRLNFVLTSTVVLILLLFNKPLLGLFGETFKTGSTVLIILCLGQMVNAFCGSVGLILQMIGKQRLFSLILSISLVINIVLNLVLVPIHGLMGAAVATVISIAFWNITATLFLRLKMNIRTYITFIQKQP